METADKSISSATRDKEINNGNEALHVCEELSSEILIVLRFQKSLYAICAPNKSKIKCLVLVIWFPWYW